MADDTPPPQPFPLLCVCVCACISACDHCWWQMTIESNIVLLKTKDQEVKEALQRMEQNEKVDVDEAVITTTPLYRQ